MSPDELHGRITLPEIAGIYRNKGMAVASDGNDPLLTDLLFPKSKDQLKKTDFIRVSVGNDDSLLVEAIKNDEVLISRTFSEGKDFDLTKGKIPIASSIGDMGTFEAQSMALGAGIESSVFMFTRNGDLVLRREMEGAVLVLLVVPLGVGSSRDIVYEKIKNEGANQS
ncbi:hypothetical protein IEN85_10760 [Pelagicoccus sp. NFK12]|uniref:Uncharacterized protein n=1 Tax=Pelagicoccus enzymogenes TaxID=2773457 RepID=A0A927IHM5_9BACT|nr:hypothetical protein [Pelagicoccus enzymogenes]MBD5779969.1 hypothetical protein [Pelagicoccus enzymogenes]